MTRHSTEDAARALSRALDGRDVGPLAARLDDASRLRVPGSSGLGGDYQGRDAIVGLLRRMAAATDGTLRFELDRTSVSRAGAVCVHGRWVGTRNGRVVSAALSFDASLAGRMFRRISIVCADRSAWDALWG